MIAAFFLVGCTFTPVYGPASQASSIAFNYGSADSRPEQLVYQTLALSFPPTTSPAALTLDVLVRTSGSRETMSRATRPETVLTVTAYATIMRGKERVMRIERVASASYSTGPQVIANKSAELDAEERAAKSVAESIRLAILAAAPKLAQ